MKRRILKLVLVTCFILTITALFTVTASAETYGDLTYTVSNGEVTITDCKSSVTSVTIPSKINGYPVTSIDYSAFSGCKSLTSVNIPDSVTSIGSSAFRDCSSLANISIPDSVTSIGFEAFRNCSRLTSVNIPDSVTSIDYLAFYNCSRLTSVSIPDSVTSIGFEAFYYCTSLTSISIPDSVTSIGSRAFYNCSRLTSVNITDIAAWCKISFNDNSSNPLYYAKKLYLNSTQLTDLTIPDSVTSIGEYAFSGCTSLTSISIGDSVTSIGSWAFRGCTRLTSVNIPDSVTSIGNEAFYGCSKLNTVYYCGTAAEWIGISIGSDNTPLTKATRKYHKYTQTTTEPTCTDDGKKITKCEFCDFESNEIIPALGHSWGEWGEKIAPTCSVAGFERRTCSACDSQENRIVAPRHTWGEWDVHAEPTCTDSGSRSRNCQSCGATETEELGVLGHNEVKHAAQAPTCTSVGWHEYTACTRCGQNNYVEIPALGHSWKAWHTVIFPTTDSVGFKERCCANCTDEEFDYVSFASGDVDGDGTLTNADLTVAVRAISGWNIEVNVALIDANYDGKYNNRDIIAFIKKLAGID